MSGQSSASSLESTKLVDDTESMFESLNIDGGEEPEIKSNITKFNEVWEPDEMSWYNHPNKAWCKKIANMDVEDGKLEMKAIVFHMDIKEVNEKTTASVSYLTKCSNGRVSVGVFTPCNFKRNMQVQHNILKMADLYFRKCTRRKAFNKMIHAINNTKGHLIFMRHDMFILLTLDDGLEYTTKVL